MTVLLKHCGYEARRPFVWGLTVVTRGKKPIHILITFIEGTKECL